MLCCPQTSGKHGRDGDKGGERVPNRHEALCRRKIRDFSWQKQNEGESPLQKGTHARTVARQEEA